MNELLEQPLGNLQHDSLLEPVQTVEALAEQLFQDRFSKKTLTNVGKYQLGFRLATQWPGAGAIGLFKHSQPVGAIFFRTSGNDLVCWKAADESQCLAGAETSEFHDDPYFLALDAKVQSRADTGHNEALVVGYDDQDSSELREKGVGLFMLSLLFEVAKRMQKTVTMREPNSRMKHIIARLRHGSMPSSNTTTIYSPEDFRNVEIHYPNDIPQILTLP